MALQTGQQKITIHILPNTSRSKDNQAMKFGQLKIQCEKQFSSKIMQKIRQRNQFQTSFCFFRYIYIYKIKASGQQLSFNIIWQTSTWTYNTNFVTYQIAYPEICSILIFFKRVWDWLLHHILCMIFRENIYHVIYIQLTD